MLFPKPLFQGARVTLIAPASPVSAERLSKSIQAVKNMGFEPIVFESCRAVHGYFSGSDTLRASDINKAFKDDSIDGIFCLRGGYGALRLLNNIDFQMIKEHPKFFSGYSDITTLHIALNQQCGFVTYHTPMPGTELYETPDPYTKKQLENVLYGKTSGFIANPPDLPMKTLVKGTASGILTGGNLSLVTASLGTPFEIDTKGKILFLEDVDEQPYHIDRMLTQLVLAGKIKDAAGLLFGYWTHVSPSDPEKSLSLDEVLQEIIIPENRPTLANFACGHEMPTASLPLGQTVTINASEHTVKFG